MSPIYINNKKIESIYTNNQSIGKVYVGDVLVFQKNNYTGDPFIFTIDTTLGTGSSFNLPLKSGYNYNMLVDWGDGQTSEITSWEDAEKNHTYVSGGTYNVSVRGVCEAWYFKETGDYLKLTSINQWGNTGFVDMEYAFSGCRNLTTVNDTDGTWCSSVTNMNGVFLNCSSLDTLDVSNWDVSSVTDMGNMFWKCSSLTTLNVSNWDVSNVTEMHYVFLSCSSLDALDVSKWNVSNVTGMGGMFFDCTSLTTLDVSKWNISNVTSMSSMFWNTPLDTTSYDALLIGWSQLPSLQPNVELGADSAKYSSGEAATARQHIIDTYEWLIRDGGPAI